MSHVAIERTNTRNYTTFNIPDTDPHLVGLEMYTIISKTDDFTVTSTATLGGVSPLITNVSGGDLNVLVNMIILVGPNPNVDYFPLFGLLQNDNALIQTGGTAVQIMTRPNVHGISMSFSSFVTLAANDTLVPFYTWSAPVELSVRGFSFNLASY